MGIHHHRGGQVRPQPLPLSHPLQTASVLNATPEGVQKFITPSSMLIQALKSSLLSQSLQGRLPAAAAILGLPPQAHCLCLDVVKVNCTLWPTVLVAFFADCSSMPFQTSSLLHSEVL